MQTSSRSILNATTGYLVARLFYTYIIASIIESINKKVNYAKTFANNCKNYVLLHAYYMWSMRGLLAVNGYSVNRSGLMDVKNFILAPIYIIISFLIVTALFPSSMNQVTSAVTTSWSSSVSITYVQVLPILVILAIAIHYLGLI